MDARPVTAGRGTEVSDRQEATLGPVNFPRGCCKSPASLYIRARIKGNE